jgi:hypothetical protein
MWILPPQAGTVVGFLRLDLMLSAVVRGAVLRRGAREGRRRVELARLRRVGRRGASWWTRAPRWMRLRRAGRLGAEAVAPGERRMRLRRVGAEPVALGELLQRMPGAWLTRSRLEMWGLTFHLLPTRICRRTLEPSHLTRRRRDNRMDPRGTDVTVLERARQAEPAMRPPTARPRPRSSASISWGESRMALRRHLEQS